MSVFSLLCLISEDGLLGGVETGVAEFVLLENGVLHISLFSGLWPSMSDDSSLPVVPVVLTL